MPPSFPVELVPHDPRWSVAAEAEAVTLHGALGTVLVSVHHIGSTAIAGIHAKPILDLLAVVVALDRLDARRRDLERLGYEWWGEFGLTGRRYCTKSALDGHRRLINLHAFVKESVDVDRHLAFRDFLRIRADRAAEYDRLKRHCRLLHSNDSHAYGDCKSDWIATVEREAMEGSSS